MARIFQLPLQAPLSNGAVLSGALATFYLTGTSTETDTYSDASLQTPHTNPVVADAEGNLPVIYLDPNVVYKMNLQDSDLNQISGYPVDPVQDALTQANLGKTFYPQLSPVEDGLTVVNYYKPYGDLLRFGTNTTPGTTDLSTALQAAIDQNNAGGPAVRLPPENVAFATTLNLYTKISIIGEGRQRSTLTYTGAAQAFVSNTPTSRIYEVLMRDFYLNDTGTGTIGIDLSSVSTGHFENLTVNGFTTGIKVTSPTSGFAVYNRFYNILVQNSTTGFHLLATSSNANSFFGCRANVCTTGAIVADSNDNHFYACQFEVCTTGVSLTASTAGISPRNYISECRFEGNTTNITVGADVSETMLVNNFHVDGTPLSDSGLRTQVIGTYGAASGHKQISAMDNANGTPFYYERTTSGGSNVPMYKMVDSATSAGTPTTLQVETGRTTGHAIRVLNGVAGSESFGIEASGKIRTNQDTANTNTPSGATAHQLPIYNEAGTLLGYIPVYGSAW